MKWEWDWSRRGIKWEKPREAAARTLGSLGLSLVGWVGVVVVKYQGEWQQAWRHRVRVDYSDPRGKGELWPTWKRGIAANVKCICHQATYIVQFFSFSYMVQFLSWKPSKSLPGIMAQKYNAWPLYPGIEKICYKECWDNWVILNMGTMLRDSIVSILNFLSVIITLCFCGGISLFLAFCVKWQYLHQIASPQKTNTQSKCSKILTTGESDDISLLLKINSGGNK